MARHIIVITLATLVCLSAVADADAKGKKGHVSLGSITITKHYDKASAN
jgi:hypothetical protein